MDTKQNVGGRDRLVRAALAVILTVVSIGAFRSGKRKTSLLAGIGALGFGFNAATKYCGINDRLGIDTTSSDSLSDQVTEQTSPVDTTYETDRESNAELSGQRSRPSVSLSCATCGDPIRLGESREPNDENEIVHATCA